MKDAVTMRVGWKLGERVTAHFLCLSLIFISCCRYDHNVQSWGWTRALSLWRRKWQRTPAFLPGKSHGQRSLVGYCPQDCRRVGHDLTTKQRQGDSADWSYLEPAHAYSFQEMKGWVPWHTWNSPITCWGAMIYLWVPQRSHSIKMIYDLCCIHIVGLTGSSILSCPQVALWFVPFFLSVYQTYVASLVAQKVENLASTKETWVRSLGLEDPLEKGMATHSSILAWRIPWTEEPGGLQSMASQRVGPNWSD